MIPGEMESTVARGPVCTFCEEKLQSGQPFCAKCGHPTQWAAHDERVLWELGQWEGSRKAKADGSGSDISERTQQLAENVKARSAAVATKPHATAGNSDSPYRRSVASRFRKVAPPDASPASPVIEKPGPAPAERAPAASARPAASERTAGSERPASQPQRTAASTAPAASPARTASQPVAPPRRAARPEPQSVGAKPAGTRVTTATTRNVSTGVVRTNRAATAHALQTEVAPAPVPEVPAVRPVPSPAETPLVIMRKSVAAPAQDGNTHTAPAAPAAAAAPVAAPPAKKARQPKPPKPPKPARAPKPKAERAPKKEKVKKEGRREHEKRERKHRRHSKRVNRRAASLDLKDGERVSLSIEGWSRFRRATLVVTNYRVALVTRFSPTVRWIPLEEVSTVTRRWQGAWSVVVAAPTEVLSLQKKKGQMLASFQQLLQSEVKEARTAGNHRHHADITQEWCDRATTIWDSRFHRLRLWGRRHPIVGLILFLACTVGAFSLTTVLTSVFSPVR